MADITNEILQPKKLLTLCVKDVVGKVEVDMQFHVELPLDQIGEVFGAIEKAAKQAKKKAFQLSLTS
tara:strand:- start:217 stop:417 length:201 start_codon:yes stop_codon:yes gene_type:complete